MCPLCDLKPHACLPSYPACLACQTSLVDYLQRPEEPEEPTSRSTTPSFHSLTHSPGLRGGAHTAGCLLQLPAPVRLSLHHSRSHPGPTIPGGRHSLPCEWVLLLLVQLVVSVLMVQIALLMLAVALYRCQVLASCLHQPATPAVQNPPGSRVSPCRHNHSLRPAPPAPPPHLLKARDQSEPGHSRARGGPIQVVHPAWPTCAASHVSQLSSRSTHLPRLRSVPGVSVPAVRLQAVQQHGLEGCLLWLWLRLSCRQQVVVQR